MYSEPHYCEIHKNIMKNFAIVVTLTILFVALVPVCGLAQNPFMSHGDEETAAKQKTEQAKPPEKPGIMKYSPKFILTWQKTVKAKMTAFGREMKENPMGKSFWLFLLFAFVYGVIHALGPGHGKTVVFSYFLSRPGKLWHGALMGNLISFVHVGSAVVLVVLLYLILKKTGMTTFEAVSPAIQKVSYSLLMLIGFYLAGKTFLEIRKNKISEEFDSNTTSDSRGMVITAVATGIVPCPGAAIILSFSIIINILTAGLISMFFIALGMGLTISSFALVTILSSKTVYSMTSKNSKAFIVSYAILSFTGSLAIIAMSAVLLLSRF